MKLRNELEPQLDVAEKRYPVVLQAIMDYAEYSDANGDEELIEYQKLEARLHHLTGKNMAIFNLWEWWEEEGAEVLAFRITLPDPEPVLGISKAELTEIIRRIKAWVSPAEIEEEESSFEEKFAHYIDDYYHSLLKVNFSTYNQSLFNRQKDADSNYFEFSAEEIADKIWRN